MSEGKIPTEIGTVFGLALHASNQCVPENFDWLVGVCDCHLEEVSIRILAGEFEVRVHLRVNDYLELGNVDFGLKVVREIQAACRHLGRLNAELVWRSRRPQEDKSKLN